MSQRWLLATIRRHGEPITFEELARTGLDQAGEPQDAKPRPSAVRSMRRALHSLVKDGFIAALGEGGRAEPHRYFPSPLLIGMSGGTDEYEAILTGMDERDLAALNEATQRVMRPR